MLIKAHDNVFFANFAYDMLLVERVKSIPQRKWNSRLKVWEFFAVKANIDYVLKWFPHATWDTEAVRLRDQVLKECERREKLSRREIDFNVDLSNINFKKTPYQHQKEAFILGRDEESFAYLMEQGTGKSKSLIDDACYNYRKGKIKQLLIICPNTVKPNWANPFKESIITEELSEHMPDDVAYDAFTYFSMLKVKEKKHFSEFLQKCRKETPTLKILVVNIEALVAERVMRDLQIFVNFADTMIVVDESSKIKNRNTIRTKACMNLRKKCKMARIMSGTPTIKNPLDIYSQFAFLDIAILGFGDYYSFKNRYADTIKIGNFYKYSFKNLDELADKIAGASYRKLKVDCLDLPPKIWTHRTVEMSPEQKRLYKQIKAQSVKNLEELEATGDMTPNNALTELMRMQQVTSGCVPIFNEIGEQIGISPIPGPNPKLEALSDLLDEINGKVIIWTKFKFEIALISGMLTNKGIGFVELHGGVSDQDRVINRARFQNDDNCKVFLAQVQTGGIGLTLNEAKYAIYFSNTFQTELRIQSEDRNHRIGQKESVEYFDLICNDSIDIKILHILKSNVEISQQVMKDGWRKWM